MLVRFIVFINVIGVGFLTQLLSAQIVDTICAGAHGEEYRVDNNTGSTFNWKVDGGYIINGNGSHVIRVNWGNDTGIFPVKVIETDKFGCPGDTVRAFVYIRSGIKVNVFGPQSICPGEIVELKASGAPSFLWNTGTKSSSISVQPKKSQKYFVVGESPDCGIDTAWFDLQVFQKPDADFLINPDKPQINEMVEFNYNGDNVPREIRWELGNPLPSEGRSTSHIFNNYGNYEVQMILIDTNGCSDTARKNVIIESEVHVYIPDAFTPNNDGLNDVFGPVCSGVESVKISVYNRWGALVYSQEGTEVGWNGTYKDELAAEGVYVYMISAVGLNHKKYFYEGTITLFR